MRRRADYCPPLAHEDEHCTAGHRKDQYDREIFEHEPPSRTARRQDFVNTTGRNFRRTPVKLGADLTPSPAVRPAKAPALQLGLVEWPNSMVA
jgi:hypothetical protein